LDIIDVSSLISNVPNKHYNLHASKIAALDSCDGLTVTYNFMEPNGGAEIDTHENKNHVFYVLEGEMQVYDGNTRQLVPKGSALIVNAGEVHQITATGKMHCIYLLVTSTRKTT